MAAVRSPQAVDSTVADFERARAHFLDQLSEAGLDHLGPMGEWIVKALKWRASDAVISCRASGSTGLFRVLGCILREPIGWSGDEARRAIGSLMEAAGALPAHGAVDRFISFELRVELGEFAEFSCEARCQVVPVSGPEGSNGIDVALRLITPMNLEAFEAARERRELGEELGVRSARKADSSRL